MNIDASQDLWAPVSRVSLEVPRDPNTPLVKEYTLNYRGLNIMIEGTFLDEGVLGSLGLS